MKEIYKFGVCIEPRLKRYTSQLQTTVLFRIKNHFLSFNNLIKKDATDNNLYSCGHKYRDTLTCNLYEMVCFLSDMRMNDKKWLLLMTQKGCIWHKEIQELYTIAIRYLLYINN